MAEITLREKGLSYRVERLSFEKGEHKRPDMLRRNPRGTIPVLSDDDIHLHETYAILDYLEHAYPSPSLLPPRREDRARALVRYHEAGVLKNAAMAMFVKVMKNEPHEEERRRFDAELESV